MKRVLMIFAGALLVCGLVFAQSEQQTPPSTANPSISDTNTAAALQGTGRITKIDPEKRTIEIGDFTTSNPASESTESPEGAATEPSATQGQTKVFKYNEHTNFASSNPESVDGRMSDLKVGDAVTVQFNDADTIVRIEEIVAPQPSQQ